jgi:hypothetical protein
LNQETEAGAGDLAEVDEEKETGGGWDEWHTHQLQILRHQIVMLSEAIAFRHIQHILDPFSK